jgi:hypothetical protein
MSNAKPESKHLDTKLPTSTGTNKSIIKTTIAGTRRNPSVYIYLKSPN